jgi:hypothetical protein
MAFFELLWNWILSHLHTSSEVQDVLKLMDSVTCREIPCKLSHIPEHHDHHHVFSFNLKIAYDLLTGAHKLMVIP